MTCLYELSLAEVTLPKVVSIHIVLSWLFLTKGFGKTLAKVVSIHIVQSWLFLTNGFGKTLAKDVSIHIVQTSHRSPVSNDKRDKVMYFIQLTCNMEEAFDPYWFENFSVVDYYPPVEQQIDREQVLIDKPLDTCIQSIAALKMQRSLPLFLCKDKLPPPEPKDTPLTSDEMTRLIKETKVKRNEKLPVSKLAFKPPIVTGGKLVNNFDYSFYLGSKIHCTCNGNNALWFRCDCPASEYERKRYEINVVSKLNIALRILTNWRNSKKRRAVIKIQRAAEKWLDAPITRDGRLGIRLRINMREHCGYGTWSRECGDREEWSLYPPK